MLEDERVRTTPRGHYEGQPGFRLLSPTTGALDAAEVAARAVTDPDQTLALLADMAAAADRRLAALATRLAGRLALELARAGPSSSRGVGRLEPGRAEHHAGDVDIDRSLDGLVEARAADRAPRLDELWVRHWRRPETAVALIVDRSGSMGGPRLAAAAVAAAACALRAPDQWSALAFGDQVVAVKSADSHRPASAVVDDVLRLRGYGTTDLAAALVAARAQLARCTARRRVALLLSDCRATAGDDPLAAARGLDELCVIAPAVDAVDAAAFAVAAGARFATITGPRSIPAAVASVIG